ncbi:unknown [Parabacteroides johnsonii CAG:246]|nr:unknown [Parabacteroides johnsonii CAG:246]
MLRITVKLIHHKDRKQRIGLNHRRVLFHNLRNLFQKRGRLTYNHPDIGQQRIHQLAEDRIEKHLFRPEIIVHGRTADPNLKSDISHLGRLIPFPDKHPFRRFDNPAFHVLKFFCTHRYNVIKYFLTKV